jgi:glucose-1-phosphate thymidylyltransferase
MRVVIPVAGSGTRLRPHTHSQPKPLLHVGGRPMIAHLLEPVVRINPEEVIFVIGYRGDQVRDYVLQNYSFRVTFIEQDQMLGLGYALYQGISRVPDGDVLVLLGDTLVECDLQKFVAAGDYVLGLKQVPDPERFGIAVVINNQIVELEEKPDKPKTNLAVIGLYYFKDVRKLQTALGDHVASRKMTRGEIQFTDALEHMIRSGVKFVPYEVQEWFDCGKKETLLSTNEHIIRTRNQTLEAPGCVIVPPVFVHPEAQVERSILGPNVSISQGARISDSVISNSIIGSNAVIDKAIIDNSLIGQEVVIRGESRILNIGDSSELASS